MAKYYKDRLLDEVRFFSYGDKQLASFVLDGERCTVLASEISIESYRGFKNDTEIKSDEVKFVTEPKEIEEVEEENETEQEAPHVDLEVVSETVTATRLSDELETPLGEIDSEDFNNFVKKHKLDPEAIQRVLDGEQKTHKGFTFKKSI